MPTSSHLPKVSAFQKKCIQAATAVDVEVSFYSDPGSPADQFEDDGYLHIRSRTGERACFSVSHGQCSDGATQNANTRVIMQRLGLGNKISSRVLVEDWVDGEEEETCPHCGQPLP